MLFGTHSKEITNWAQSSKCFVQSIREKYRRQNDIYNMFSQRYFSLVPIKCVQITSGVLVLKENQTLNASTTCHLQLLLLFSDCYIFKTWSS